MIDMQTPIDAIESRAHEIGEFVAGIEHEWKEVREKVAKAREFALYLNRSPENFTTVDIEEYGARIVEALDGI